MHWMVSVRTLGLVALLFTLAAFAFVTMFAVTLTIAHLSICIPAIAAGILQILSLGTLGYFTYQRSKPPGNDGHQRRLRQRSSLYILGGLPAVLAAALTVLTFSWMKIRFDDVQGLIPGRRTSELLTSAFVVWGCSVVAQAAFYSASLLRTRLSPEEDGTSSTSANFEEVTQMQETSRPNTTESMQSQSFQILAVQKPHRSPTSSEAISSLRSSLSVVVRPMTSRTKLLTRQRSSPCDSKSSSFETPSRERMTQENGFDTWDTSSVGPQIRETVLQSSPPSAGSGLEPIPGSRPESPANALDGPFLPQSPSQRTPNFSRPSTRQRSSSNEDHIHPLFRTSSPTPPPTPTPGTVVTAAPMAGQVINGRILNRMRSGSLPSSPSPLVHSESFDTWSLARSTTPPTREKTPPIPDFVLSAGTRASFVGYGKRKASLRSTDADTGH
ncbi:MAG: hypothetical protein M1830_010429 [Pleopsidium flavum]|nr:MAG: hypothetical protein M1830_010429 [Pleopsidium flavum]